jgi:hypothetical protein
MELTPLSSQKFDIGRCAVLGVSPAWDGSTPLFDALTHYGTVDGTVEIAANPEYSELTIESTGPAALIRYLRGERPTFTLGVYPNPDNVAVFSPTGKGSAGQSLQRLAKTHTLWLVPEQLFITYDANGNGTYATITYNGTAFLKDGVALTADEQTLVDLSVICWRVDFSRLTPRYSVEDGGKSLTNVDVTVQQDLTQPEGCQLYLMVGEAADFSVDFDGES